MEMHMELHGIGTATQDDTPPMKNKALFGTTPELNDNVTPSTAA